MAIMAAITGIGAADTMSGRDGSITAAVCGAVALVGSLADSTVGFMAMRRPCRGGAVSVAGMPAVAAVIWAAADMRAAGVAGIGDRPGSNGFGADHDRG
jgi:hypothetical protein